MFLVYFIFIQEILAFPQINLDRTEWTNDLISIRYYCLHVTVETDLYEIVSYCMSVWPTELNIEKINQDRYFTFADLSERNITSQQLYTWSAPIDVIENYQLYLNEKSLLLSTELFYNCTLPRFGPMCQYEFVDDELSNYNFLNEFIHDFYGKNQYKPTNLTCYMHLECNRGAKSICLDWSEICDGKIDCLNDAIDEQQCWQLENHGCEQDEFRCDIGQCIPQLFLHDNPDIPDCLDATDEIFPKITRRFTCDRLEPSFACEDVTCAKDHWLGQSKPLTSSCVNERTELILQAIFAEKPHTIRDDCWTAFKCTLHMPIVGDPICRELCQNGGCPRIIRETCPEMIFAPTSPILFGHIYYAYMKNQSRYSNNFPQFPQYICYNDQLCDGFLPNKTLVSFNNMTCRAPQDFPLEFKLVTSRSSWLHYCVAPYYQQLYKCNTIVRNDLTVCNKSTMYQCINSSKCISKYRLVDGFTDCNYNDDEDPILFDQGLKNSFKCTTINKYIPWNRVDDGSCDCDYDEYSLCDDEQPDLHFIKKHISFSTICDGFTELIPINGTKINETDETDCEYWPCNNTYTRCDGFWNCLNGADEVDCNPSPLLKCPRHSHICISIETKQLICLDLEKANNGEIDCLGGIDEPQLCRTKHHDPSIGNFYCRNDVDLPCRPSLDVCRQNGQICQLGTDTDSCTDLWNVSSEFTDHCQEDSIVNRTNIERYFCSLFDDVQKPKKVHFLLERPRYPVKNITKQSANTIISRSTITLGKHPNPCHRGIPVHIRNSTNITCLCPPSFYGELCQYQNQRVVLTVKFQPFDISKQTPVAIVMSLIDDSDQRTVHSYQQLIYLPRQHCSMKFNVYLLYSIRPKNESKNYSVHIDFYEKISLKYQGSLLLPIEFGFLPVYRIATILNIPSTIDSDSICADRRCIHGKCIKYFKNSKNHSFCQCNPGWSGQYCTMPYTCLCASDSLCVGISAANRSICVCPLNKWGSRCLLDDQICQSSLCYNGGRCLPLDPYIITKKKFECICPKGYFGDRCETPNNKIILSFSKEIILPSSLLVHFIQIMNNTSPEIGNTFKQISVYQNLITIFWSRPFHIAFAELSNNVYYLIIVQKIYNQSMTVIKTLQSSDRCLNINEIFNQTFAQSPLITRIKYYHLICEQNSLSCFYDEVHMCLCTNYGNQCHANCFEFNHTLTRDCSGRSNCENDGQCLQDSIICPKTSVCRCLPCFHGAQCQFNSEQFDLSLDGILGDHIGSHISIINQPAIIQMSIVLSIIVTLAGLLNGILSMITFSNRITRKTGCGVYLLISSIVTTITIIVFTLKFWILIITQMKSITHRSFLYVQCLSLDFLLRTGLHMDQWLSACIAIERIMIAFKGINFDQKKSKRISKYIIIILLLTMIGTTIHDPFHRRLIDDGNDDDDDKRIWCIITYSYRFRIYNSIMNIIHFSVPVCINILGAIIIILFATHQRAYFKRIKIIGKFCMNK